MAHNSVASTLFVIEDNPTQSETLMDILEAEGLHPIACFSGKEALVVCERQTAYVAILDLRLPDMDGLEVLQHLKKQIPEIKVIINTAYASLESAIEAVNRGAFAYVQKMGDVDELLAHVHRAFHEHLATYSERLEREVSIRTIELSQANMALRKEILAHKQAEEQLHATLQQKTFLLSEVQHRTRNNLTVISALLGFQANYAGDPHTQAMLTAVQARLDAMALLHAKLHREDLMTVNVPEYVTELAEMLVHNDYMAYAKQVSISYDLEPCSLVIDNALSFGLLCYEILSNACRHAFPDRQAGDIHIQFHTTDEGARELCVRDNGVGLPDGFDVTQTHTLGFYFIGMMARSLRGTVAVYRREPGTEVAIRFNEPQYKSRI
ncbi:signal transduction histidine kinase [Candidatus Moduliflexus flocculans]|uniref:histidine kinase n=1 Tax=Candidatus Moduliflexus flocculans TaxID=1499966 RepID=A0A081BN93_9BACT|nr:signal transduction histidine kinase [Candidatus Moduliflexus flocculans]